MKRSDFLATTKTLAGLAILSPLLDACSRSNDVTPKLSGNITIDLTNPSYSALQTVGGVVLAQGVYIVRTGTSTYIGLSPVCTHAGCTVNFDSTGKEFVCPCHGGVYDINGKVVSGPPPAPLAQYQITVSGNTLTVVA